MSDEVSAINGWQPPLVSYDYGYSKRIATQADVDWMERQIERLNRMLRLIADLEKVRKEAREDQPNFLPHPDDIKVPA